MLLINMYMYRCDPEIICYILQSLLCVCIYLKVVIFSE